MDNLTKTTTALVRLIQQQRLDLSNEKRMQEALEIALTSNGFNFEREKVLSKKDIPDFLVDGKIVIECKLRGARKVDIYNQLNRYSEHECVKALILASNICMGIPTELNGKPVYVASCSRAYL